jgi:hypothetical protein
MRLRVQVQASGDPSSQPYSLRYQKNGSGGYVDVPVGGSVTPTLSYGASGGFAYSGTNPAPSYPSGITADSELVLIVGQKPSSANGGTVTTPTGWTLRASLTGSNDGNTGGYTTTLGADTGNCNIYVYTKDSVSGSESGTLTVTTGTNNVAWARIVRLQKSVPGTVSWAAATGKDTSAGSVSIATGALDLAAGDYLIGGMVIPTDVTTPSQFSAHALSQSGTTFGTVSEIGEADSTTSNDIGGYLIQAPVSSGSGTGAVTMSATAGGTTTNVRGPGFLLRARPVTVANEVYIAASANITAGGEATTQQLTAGSGSFTTGRMWDNENGSDSIDIGEDDFTELEFNLATQSPATDGDYFDFRVYAGGSPLDTYTVTPRWTIGGGPATYNDSVTESGSVSDALSSIATFPRSITEATTATDAIAAVGTFLRALTETIAPTDAISGGLSLSSSLAESVTPTDAMTGGSAFASSLAESITPTYAPSLAYATNPSLAESLTTLDTVASALQAVAALTEAVAATDAPTAARVTAPSLTEAVSAADTFTGGLALLASLSESTAVADTVASILAAVGALAESFTITDTQNADQAGVISVSMSESFTASDAVASALNALNALTETLTLSETVARAWITTAGLAESVTPTDLVSATRALAAGLTEAATLVDSVSSIGVFSVQIAEAAALIDAPQAAALLSAALGEAITPTDIVAAIAASYPGDPRRTFTVSGGRGLVVQAGDRVVVVTRNDRTVH